MTHPTDEEQEFIRSLRNKYGQSSGVADDAWKAYVARRKWRYQQREKFRAVYLVPGLIPMFINYDGTGSSACGSIVAYVIFTLAAWQIGSGFYGWRYWFVKDRFKPSDPRRRRSNVRF